jgi:uncharacterized circularly permuted ATP-grasp superfamily protein
MPSTTVSSFDEMIDAEGKVRPAYAGYREWFDAQPKWLEKQGKAAEGVFRRTGITFNVYGEDAGQERLIPFDMIPRIITRDEWKKLSVGIEQRVRALNAFLHDLYHKREIVKAGKFPEGCWRERGFPARNGGLHAAGRGLHAYRGHRSCAHRAG